MHGADTELDRQVLELIKDPLTHMVRNCGDHGLESAGGAPRRRQARNRPHHPRTPTTRAATSSSRSPTTAAASPLDRIRAKALENGLATEAELAAHVRDADPALHLPRRLLDRREVTNVSGRGVGMDVVKTNIEKIGGTIELKSVAGQGHDLHHQDPADAGDRLGADRRGAAASASPFRRSASSSWCARGWRGHNEAGGT